MPKRFSNGKQTGATTRKQNLGDRPSGAFSPCSMLQICLRGRTFALKEDFSGERTGEQFSSDILLVPIQKCGVRMERGSRDPETNSFRLFPTEGGRGTSGSGSWR